MRTNERITTTTTIGIGMDGVGSAVLFGIVLILTAAFLLTYYSPLSICIRENDEQYCRDKIIERSK